MGHIRITNYHNHDWTTFAQNNYDNISKLIVKIVHMFEAPKAPFIAADIYIYIYIGGT